MALSNGSITKNPKLNLGKFKSMLWREKIDVFRETTRKTWYSIGYSSRAAAQKPLLSKLHKSNRLQLAEKWSGWPSKSKRK